MTPRLQRLSREKWELALKVVDKAWREADGPLTTLQAPPGLKHLNASEWETVCRTLWVLQRQQENSPLH
jgi:hypothetical protein